MIFEKQRNGLLVSGKIKHLHNRQRHVMENTCTLVGRRLLSRLAARTEKQAR